MVQISDLFVDPAALPDNFGGFFQLLFLMMCYAFFLYTGSHYISDGSELLLLVPSIAGIVGSVVLPVLGAVPDGAIVLFSGMGPDAQTQLTIGVGALAGSTVMLITLPWAMCIWQGRVDLDAQGNPLYKRPPNAPKGWTKLSTDKGLYHTLFHTGIEINKPMRINAGILIATALAYGIIQIPAFIVGCGKGECEHGDQEKWWAFAGFLFALFSFIAYLVYQVRVGGEEKYHEEKMIDIVGSKISEGHVSVAQAFFAFMQAEGVNEEEELAAAQALLTHEPSTAAIAAAAGVPAVSAVNAASRQGSGLDQPHLLHAERRLKTMLRRFFRKYDKDANGSIDLSELTLLLKDIGAQKMSPAAVKELFKAMDSSGDERVDFDEFCTAVMLIIQNPDMISNIEKKAAAAIVPLAERKKNSAANSHNASANPLPDEENSIGGSPLQRAEFPGSSVGLKPLDGAEDDAGEDEVEEEEEEVPEDLQNLSQEEQQRAIKVRAAWMMSFGTILILLFSDPMVDCLGELGNRIHVPGFYVAFLLAPLAANASELIAAVNYAAKKTPGTITISITSLEGSAAMNNTFCLMIFLILIFAKSLVWEFSAETISILFVEIVVVLFSLKKVHRGIDAIFLLTLYPLAMGLVAFLENVVNLN